MDQEEWNLSELEGVQLDDDFILHHISNDENIVSRSSTPEKSRVNYAGETPFAHYTSGSAVHPIVQQSSSKALNSCLSLSENPHLVLLPSEFRDVPQQKLIRICYEFVDCFLVKKWETLKLMDHSIVQCLEVLNTVQEVLEDFMKKLELIQHEIGDVRDQLTSTTTHLENYRASETVLWKVISQLLLPPEIVSLLTRASDERLGEQYKIGLRMLLHYLHNRSSTWKEMAKESKQLASAVSSSAQSEHNSSTSSPVQSKDYQERALREVRFSFKNCKPYHDLVSVMDSVTVLACVKVKKFLSSQLQLLAVPLTNICIQQDHRLKEHKFYVSFLKNAPQLLRHPRMGGVEPELPANRIPYQIANALYREFQHEYSTILSTICLEKIKGYLIQCMSAELDPPPMSKNSPVSLSSAPSGGASAVLSTGVEGGGGALSSSDGMNTIHFSVPLLSDMLAAVSGVEPWNLGKRGRNIFRKLFNAPLIPLLEQLQVQKHPYEETIRSLFRLLCDMATHEYLFSFQFFSGDTAVFSQTLFPILEFICEFVSKIVKKPSPQEEGQLSRWAQEYKGRRGSFTASATVGSGSNTTARATEDSYGLLILIRLCHEFQNYMTAVRRLPCLNGFFENVLQLLWPAFMQNFQMQRIAVRCVAPAALAACLSGPSTSTIGKKMASVHPLTQCLSEYLRQLLSIILGTSNLKMLSPSDDKAKFGTDKAEETESNNQFFCSFLPLLSYLPTKVMKDGRIKINWQSIQQQACAIMDESGRGNNIALSNEQVLMLLEEMVLLRHEAVGRLEELALYILHGSGKNKSVPEKDITLLKTAFVLNNIYYMYAKLYHTPIIQSASPPPLKANEEEAETYLPQPTRKSVFPGDDYTRDERRKNRSSEDDEEEEEKVEEDTVGNRCNLEDVWNIYECTRKRFVHCVLEKYLSEMCELAPEVKEKEEKEKGGIAKAVDSVGDPLRVRREAERFASEWVTILNGMRDTTRELVSDPGHQKEVMAQTCMEYLLLNTRFHSAVNQCAVAHPDIFKGAPLRNLVSNQKLLAHMRTFVTFPV